MEENYEQEIHPELGQDSTLDADLASRLMDTARWMRLMVNIAFGIFVLLLLMLFLAGPQIVTQMQILMPSEEVTHMQIVVAFSFVIAIGAFVLYFLFRASQRIKEAITNNNQALFNDGLKDLKTYFTIYGVFTALQVLLTILSF